MTFLKIDLQAGTDMAEILKKPAFAEPRLVIFRGDSPQGFVVAEKEIVFEVTQFCVCDGIVSLLASYYAFYVNYPKSVVANSFCCLFKRFCLVVKTLTSSARPH